MSYYCHACPTVIEEDDIDTCIACMRKQLKEAGWWERNSTTYIAPNGHWFRGPVGAWRAMKKASAATTERKPE